MIIAGDDETEELVLKEKLGKISLKFFSIFLLPVSKNLVITTRDDENVISVIDISKIILYFFKCKF